MGRAYSGHRLTMPHVEKLKLVRTKLVLGIHTAVSLPLTHPPTLIWDSEQVHCKHWNIHSGGAVSEPVSGTGLKLTPYGTTQEFVLDTPIYPTKFVLPSITKHALKLFNYYIYPLESRT